MPRTKKTEKKKKPMPAGAGAAAGGKPEQYVFAVGRRKESIALIRLYPVKGAITVNGKPLADYFSLQKLQETVRMPFSELKTEPLRVDARVRGGGMRGQAEALRLGISRALVILRPESKARLRTAGLLTRDARVKERRKYGLKKARRAPQWQKR